MATTSTKHWIAGTVGAANLVALCLFGDGCSQTEGEGSLRDVGNLSATASPYGSGGGSGAGGSSGGPECLPTDKNAACRVAFEGVLNTLAEVKAGRATLADFQAQITGSACSALPQFHSELTDLANSVAYLEFGGLTESCDGIKFQWVHSSGVPGSAGNDAVKTALLNLVKKVDTVSGMAPKSYLYLLAHNFLPDPDVLYGGTKSRVLADYPPGIEVDVLIDPIDVSLAALLGGTVGASAAGHIIADGVPDTTQSVTVRRVLSFSTWRLGPATTYPAEALCWGDGTFLPIVAGTVLSVGTISRNGTQYSCSPIPEPQPPTVTTVQINGGSAQQSTVASLTVSFSETVTFPSGIQAAFELDRLGPGAPIGRVSPTLTESGHTVMLTFAADPSFSASGFLLDGNYRLRLVSPNIQGAAGPLDGNRDQTSGDNFEIAVKSCGAPVKGDGNCNGVVDAADYTVWRDRFGQVGVPRLPGTLCTPTGDLNNDGTVDGADFLLWQRSFGAKGLACGTF